MKNQVKKIMITMGAIIALPLMSSSAFGAAALYQAEIGNGDEVTNLNCPLLATTVTINMSSGIFGALECNEAASNIKVGTCSKGGSITGSTGTCQVTSVAGITPVTYNDPTCDAAAVTAGTTFLIAGRSFYSTSTSGGSLAAASLGDNVVCDSTNVAAKLY